MKVLVHLNTSLARSSEGVLNLFFFFFWPAVWLFLSCESASVLFLLLMSVATGLYHQLPCCEQMHYRQLAALHFPSSSAVILTLTFDSPVSSSLFWSHVHFVPFWNHTNIWDWLESPSDWSVALNQTYSIGLPGSKNFLGLCCHKLVGLGWWPRLGNTVYPLNISMVQ